MPRAGLGHALDLISLMQPAGALCDFSTYFNGSSEVEENFVIKAPLRMDGDELIHIGSQNNMINKSWELLMDATVLFSDLGLNDRYVRFTNTMDSSTRVIVHFINLSQDFRVLLRDNANFTVYDQVFNLPSPSLENFSIKFDLPTLTVTVTVDGIELDSRVVTTPNAFFVDRYAISYEGTSSSNHMIMLLRNVSFTGIGKTTFISNQDDGKFFVSDEGLAWTLTEDVSGSSQYPGTGFVWPTDTLFRQPKTAALNLNGDSLTGSFTVTSFDTAWEILMRINVENTAVANDRLVYIDNSSGSGVITIDVGGSIIRAFGTDNSGILTMNISVAYTTGTDAIVKLTYDGVSSATLDVNDVTSTDASVDFTTNGLDVNRIAVGAQAADFRELECFISCCNISLIDDWNFIGRLPTQTDPNGGTFIGLTNSIVLTLDDDAPTGSYFPYFDVWNTAYLISDTVCTQPVGNQELVTDGGIAVTDNGEFVFNEVV